MIEIKDKINCVGCGACLNICPNNAIDFITDKAGFNYPIVNKKDCINCNLCEKVCPINNNANNNDSPRCKLSWNKDSDIRNQSTSGGVFSALAENIINNDGYVCGVEISDDFSIRHGIINEISELKQFRRAKYVQSDLHNIFSAIKSYLQKDIQVLFSGTPCQVSALKNFLRKNYHNLYTVEVICHGVVSQKVFDAYLKSLSKIKNDKIESFEFRNKDISWERYTNKAFFKTGSIYQEERIKDAYMTGYLKHNLYIRPSCTQCKFKGFPRVADITLGDFWGVEKIRQYDTSLGVSAVLLNSIKGEELFSRISDQLYVEDVSLEEIVINNESLVNSVLLGDYSDYFYSKFEKKDFQQLISKIDKKALWKNEDLTIKDKIFILKNNVLEKFKQ